MPLREGEGSLRVFSGLEAKLFYKNEKGEICEMPLSLMEMTTESNSFFSDYEIDIKATSSCKVTVIKKATNSTTFTDEEWEEILENVKGEL